MFVIEDVLFKSTTSSTLLEPDDEEPWGAVNAWWSNDAWDEGNESDESQIANEPQPSPPNIEAVECNDAQHLAPWIDEGGDAWNDAEWWDDAAWWATCAYENGDDQWYDQVPIGQHQESWDIVGSSDVDVSDQLVEVPTHDEECWGDGCELPTEPASWNHAGDVLQNPTDQESWWGECSTDPKFQYENWYGDVDHQAWYDEMMEGHDVWEHHDPQNDSEFDDFGTDESWGWYDGDEWWANEWNDVWPTTPADTFVTELEQQLDQMDKTAPLPGKD